MVVNGMLARVVPQSTCRVPPAFVSSIVIVAQLGGRRRGGHGHRRTAQVLALRVGDAPLAGLLADDPLPLLLAGQRV